MAKGDNKMYSANGEDIFVVDGHMHFWDAGPDNHRNDYGNAWIKCFYDYHSALSPAEYVWGFDKYCNYGEEALISDLFLEGYVDVAVLNSTYLYEFFKTGFNTHQKNNVVKQKHPDRFVLCGSFDPREEEAGLDKFREMMADYPIGGLKLYTAEWRGESKGWKLNDPWSYNYLELAQEMGIKNVHVHKGPTIYPSQPRRLRRERRGLRRHRLPRPQLHSRARGSAPAGRFLLDCHSGTQRLRRNVGGHGLHQLPPQILRRDYGQPALLAGRGPHISSAATTPSGAPSG